MRRLKALRQGQNSPPAQTSRPCRNNAVSRSPSSNHPSSAAARPDATFLWLTLPADRKKARAWERSKHQRNIKETSKKYQRNIKGSRIQEPDRRSAQRTTINIEEYRDQIGPAYHYKYRRIPEPDRRSSQRTIINIEESRNRIGTAYHHKYRRIPEPDCRSA